jgi:hypothetical protein
MPLPPIAPVPDETAESTAGLARALAEAGLAAESVTPPNGTEGPVTALVVSGEGACWAGADPPVDRRLSLRGGTVDGGCEGRAVLWVTPGCGALTVTCPGRLVNFRWDERVVDADGEGDVGATAFGSIDLGSVSCR